jgi:hypothetical protein
MKLSGSCKYSGQQWCVVTTLAISESELFIKYCKDTCILCDNNYHPYQDFNPRQATSIQVLSVCQLHTSVVSLQTMIIHLSYISPGGGAGIIFWIQWGKLVPFDSKIWCTRTETSGSSLRWTICFATTAPTTFKWQNIYIKLRILHISVWSSLHLVKVKPPD